VIESTPSKVTLTGPDAEAFVRQVAAGPSEEQRRTIAEAVNRGRDLVRQIAETGRAIVRL